MWRMLEADLKYFSFHIALSFGLVSLCFLMILGLGDEGTTKLIGASTFVMLVALIFIGVKEDSEGRERVRVMLPLPIDEIAMGRILFLFAFQGGMFALWLLMYFIVDFRDDPEMIWGVITANSLIMSFVMTFVVAEDLGHVGASFSRTIFWVGMIILALAKKSWGIPKYRLGDGGISVNYPSAFAMATWPDPSYPGGPPSDQSEGGPRFPYRQSY